MNVILYVFDALRADHVSSYDYHRDTTPNLDQIAENGVLFEQCISPSTYTRPVAVSILTGLSPLVHGTQHIDDGYNPPISPLPEQFNAAGFETVGIGSMPNLRGEWGFSQGYDVYKDMFEDDEVIERRQVKPDGRNIPLTRAEDVNRGFIEWHKNRTEPTKPYFAKIWSTETHVPYFPPDEYREYVDPEYQGEVDGSADSHRNVESDEDVQHLINLYDGEVKYNDHCLGELIDYLDTVGELNDTLLVIISDHGDGFGEHGQFGHGIAPHEELIHVPCVIRPPRDLKESRGRKIKEQISLQDIYPTLMELIDGLPSVDIIDLLQGKSFANALYDDEVQGHEFTYSNIHLENIKEEYNSIRTVEWKYIRMNQEKDMSWFVDVISSALKKGILTDIIRDPRYYYNRHYHTSSGAELYNLAKDPAEEENVYDENENEAQKLDNELDKWIEQCEELREELQTIDSKIEMSTEAQERLKRLGYLQE